MVYIDEAQVEIQAVEWLKELDYDYVYGPDIAPDMLTAANGADA